jgi:hypothetical protein
MPLHSFGLAWSFVFKVSSELTLFRCFCVSQVSFNPQDNTQLCVIGNTIFRHFRYSEGNLKPFNFQKMEPQNYLCHAWVSEERIVVGTDNGRLLLFEAGELRNEINLASDK